MENLRRLWQFARRPQEFIFDPSGEWLYRWRIFVAIAFLYNGLAIVCRSCLVGLQTKYLAGWMAVDYIADSVYVADIVVKMHTGFMEQGILVKASDRIRPRYLRTLKFKLDALSLLPTDLLLIAVGTNYPEVRFNRLLRASAFFEALDQHETRTSYPKSFRVFKLIIYIIFIIHWNACIYFALSKHIGFGVDKWVYPNISNPAFATLTRQYIYSFYFSTVVLTTVGDFPRANNEKEYLFMVFDFMVTIFVFATIVGNLGSIISSLNEHKDHFQAQVTSVKQYMKNRNVERQTEMKVATWFEFLRSSDQIFSEEMVLNLLPEKLRAAVAINIHLNTLQKVEIFKNCEIKLLEELVLKLKPQLSSPGDYVCHKGDIGKEMYIIKEGNLAVVSDDASVTYAVLGDGTYFGEISILNIKGSKAGNRRTANIRSNGYSDLFRLSKEDLTEVLQEFPAAREILEEKGRQILTKMNLLDLEDASAVVDTTALEQQLDSIEKSVDELQTRMARIMAEHSAVKRKIKVRVRRLEKALKKPRRTVTSESENKLSSSSSFSDLE
uniref:Cyclic nucleotide gated channel subunit alpha 4 n=1 Tax=Eptatretus burgeri TaxID=7764 RepID=A0A8C4QAK7_EPTBU